MGLWGRLFGSAKVESSGPSTYPETKMPTRVERHPSAKEGLFYWMQVDQVVGGGEDPKAGTETRTYTALVADGVSFEEACARSMSFREDQRWDQHLLIENRSEGYRIGRYLTHYADGTLREVDIRRSKEFP